MRLAILLDLHGAMVAEGCDDVEGMLLSKIPERLGDIPIGVVFDFHANTTPAFVERGDVFCGIRHVPIPCESAAGVLTLPEARSKRPCGVTLKRRELGGMASRIRTGPVFWADLVLRDSGEMSSNSKFSWRASRLWFTEVDKQ